MSVGFLSIYLLAVTEVTFAAFAIDKNRAIRHAWRIPEATLLGLCLIGGSIGGFAAMRAVRHKTRKPLFTIGVPALMVVNALCVEALTGFASSLF